MAAPTYPIKGIPVPAGSPIPIRQEITAWASRPENARQVSLFMRALTLFKTFDIQNQLSYFQIAGIHCYPLVSWDGTPANTNPKGTDPFPGYCAHNLITFPTWHRPYVLLYEQVLFKVMETVINDMNLPSNEKQLWVDASLQFRLPYWDWARTQSYNNNNFGVPYLCTTPTVTILAAGGKMETFPNPLTGFTNPLKVDGKPVPMGDKAMGKYAIGNDPLGPITDGTLPWSECIGVSRYGIFSSQPPSQWANGVNNWVAVNYSMATPPWYGTPWKDPGTWADAVTRMLSPGYFKDFPHFASTLLNPNPNTPNSNFLSLEFIHNVIHNVTGGQFMNAQAAKGQPPQAIGLGHMSDVPVAAFDPIFWLHHCNVDRLTAIWQALNPGQWYTDNTGNEPLLPFHYNSTRGSWTPDMGRDWRKLGYQYDGLTPAGDSLNADGSINDATYASAVRAYVDDLYESTVKVVKSVPGYTSNNGEFNDYIINVIYDRYALNGRAYSILFFLGDPPAEISTYPTSETYIGQVYTFSAPIEVDGAVACQNCADQKTNKILSKAHIPLTQKLLRRIHGDDLTGQPRPSDTLLGVPAVEIGPLNPQPVEQVLEAGLQWVFVELGGRILDHTHFPNTEIAVLHGTGRVRDLDDPEPRYSGYKQLHRATLNNPTGSGNEGNRLQLIHDDP